MTRFNGTVSRKFLSKAPYSFLEKSSSSRIKWKKEILSTEKFGPKVIVTAITIPTLPMIMIQSEKIGLSRNMISPGVSIGQVR